MVPRSLILLMLLVPITVSYGPCPQPYVFGPQPGGCRGGYSPWRGGYGVQVPQGVRYGQPYGNTYVGQYQIPHGGGAYVTAPPVGIPFVENVVHPTQSTPIDHSTSIATGIQSTTNDEQADIFDEFKVHDVEELLTGGKQRTDTSAHSNLFLQPLQPPGNSTLESRPTPYKPSISASHDELPSTGQTTKDIVNENTITDAKTGFIPQSKPLPASFTQTTTIEKDPFSESAGLRKPSPVSPSLSPSSSSRAQTMVPPSTGGAYAVAPRPIAIPQPQTTQYVRPFPFGPHNMPQQPYVVSPYGGYRPVTPQPLAPQPLAPCAPVPGHGPVSPYPSGPYPSAPQPLPGPVYTRIGGGHGGYVSPPLAPRGGLPPFVDCCGKCRSPCRSRIKRQLAAKLFDAEGKQFDIPPTKDGRCTSEELRETMLKSTTSTSTLSKRVIQKAAEEQFGGLFSVFCSKENFSYTSRSSFYCQTSKNDVVCFAFRHN